MTILQYHSKDDIKSLTKRKEHYNNSSTLVAWSSSTGIVMIHQLFHALKILAIFNDTLDGNYFLFDSRYYCRNNLNEYRVEQRRNKNMDEKQYTRERVYDGQLTWRTVCLVPRFHVLHRRSNLRKRTYWLKWASSCRLLVTILLPCQ